LSYDAADNSAKSYALAIEECRKKLESEPPIDCAGARVKIINEPKRVLIYGIRKNWQCAFVYIGSTSRSMRDRIRAHVGEAKSGSDLPFHVWVLENFDGFEAVVLEQVDERDRVSRERHWVVIHKNTLLNVTDGGPGMSGHKFAGSAHAKRIGEAGKTGGHFHCERCGERFWRRRNAILKGQNKFCSRVCSNARHKEVSHVEA
jgi:hypothetical protein